MSRILEILAQIDKANAEQSPDRRADWADALVAELRDIFTNALDARQADFCGDGILHTRNRCQR